MKIICCWLLLLFAGLAHVRACSCNPLSVEDAVEQADIIFRGKCLLGNTNWISGGLKYSFEVTETWKKGTDRFFVVNTPMQGEACGYAFVEGEEYVVFVSKKFSPKTDQCMGNQPIGLADAYLQQLGPGAVPRQSPLINSLYWIIGFISLIPLIFMAVFIFRKRSQSVD